MFAGPVIATIVAALLLGAWCALAAYRDRWLDRSHVVGAAIIELAVLAQAVLALVRIVGGARPPAPLTFAGYLITAVLFLPLCFVLAAMERTRWGSVIAAGGCLVVAVLALRLWQVWLHG
ncbi:MAG: hypothetical protein ACM30G_04960 [Micromonosporaceae bacterium]